LRPEGCRRGTLAPAKNEPANPATRRVHLSEQNADDAQNHAEPQPGENERQHGGQIDAGIDLCAGCAEHARHRDQGPGDGAYCRKAVYQDHKVGMGDAENDLFKKTDPECQNEHRQKDRLRHCQDEMDQRIEGFGKMQPFTEQKAVRDGKRGCNDERNRHLARGKP
jgi:hypothetical protein